MLQQSLQYQKKCFLCGTDIYGQLRNAPNNFCIKCLVDRKTINEIDTVSKTSKCTRMLKVTSIETPINLNIKDETRDSLEAKDDYDNDCWEDYEVNYSSTVFDEVIITFRDIISFKVVADIQQMKLKPTGKTVKRKRNTIGIVNPWKKTKATKAKNYCTMREMIRTIRSKTTPQVTGRKPKKVNSRNSPQYISIKDELVRYSQEFQASKIQATSSNIILKQEFGFEKPPAVYEVVDLSFSSQNSSVFHFGDLERTLSEVFVQGAVKETPALDNCLEDRVNSPQLIQSNSLHEVCEKVDLSLSSENSSIFSFNSMQRSLSKVIEETMFEKIDDLDDPMEENANSQKLIQTNSIHKLSNISQTNNNFQTLMQESIEFSESEQNVQEPIVESDKDPNSFVDENNNLKEESVKAVVKGDKNSKIVRMCCMRYCNCRICQL